MMGTRGGGRKPAFEALEHRRILSVDGVLAESSTVDALQLEQPLRIQVFGDSLSAGVAPGDAARREISPRRSFRPALWDVMQSQSATPLNIEFVGSSTYNATTLPDRAAAHSTYRGFTTISFFPDDRPNFGSDPYAPVNNNGNNADGWATLQTDVALIMLGTNDLLEGRLVVDVPQYPRFRSIDQMLRTTMDVLRDENEQVTILLGTLPPYQGGARVEETNTVIRNLVNANASIGWAGSTSESPIYLVDHYNGEGENPAYDVDVHSDDGVHPNFAGEDLIAANWWSVLRPLVAEPDQAASGPSVISMAQPEVFLTESNGGTPAVLVNRSGDTSANLTVAYDVFGTAVEEEDYASLSGELIFPAGQSQVAIPLSVIDDTTEESEEFIFLRLLVGDQYELGDSITTIVVLADNDGASIPPNVSIRPLVSSIPESAGLMSVAEISRDGDLTEPLTVFFHLSGTAQLGADFGAPDGQLVIPAGETSVTLDITVLDDPRIENSRESIIVELIRDPNYVVSLDDAAFIDILDDDDGTVPRVSVTAFQTSIVESNRGVAQFRVSRSGSISSELAVEFNVSGTVEAGEDYATLPNRVVIPAGANSAFIDIALLDDDLSEGDELLEVHLAPSVYYDLGLTSARVTLTDDESSQSLAAFLNQYQFHHEFLNTPILG